MPYDILAIADVFADVVITGKEKPEFGQVEKISESYEIELGGSAPIFASQFAKLGGKIALISVVGDDLLGTFVKKRMQDLGIDIQQIHTSPTQKTPMGLNLSILGDRSMLTVLGAMEEIVPDLVTDALLAQTRHWHIASFFLLEQLHDFWLSFLQKLKSKGITSSLDTNWAPTGDWYRVKPLLPWIDVFLPNENEAMAIAGMADVHQAGHELSKTGNLVVVKRGEEGATVFFRDEITEYPVPATLRTNLQVADTTGAGDSFDGGFIYEWLQGAPLEKCLETAIRCGTSSVQCVGGINGQLLQEQYKQPIG